MFQMDILVPTITEWQQPPGDPNFQTDPTSLLLQYVPTISGSAAVLGAFIVTQDISRMARGFQGISRFWENMMGCSRELREGTERRLQRSKELVSFLQIISSQF